MWQACRAAALQRLRASAATTSSQLSSAPLRSARHLLEHPVTASSISRQWPSATARFSSSSTTVRAQPLEVCGIALRDLARRPRHELEAELGADVLRAARRSLPQLWDELLKQAQEHHDDDESDGPPVAKDVAKQLFLAAHRHQLSDLALRIFEYMDAAFPTQIDFVVYGEVFTMLTRAGKTDETLAVFERNKGLYSDDHPAPELIYRFGMFGLLGKRDFAAVDALLEEMARLDIPLTNELKSRLMIAYAKHGQNEKVMEIYQTLDTHAGRWHEADVDRVVNSMGLIHCADEAFEFYRNARIKLSGNTLVALLNVCRKNNRPKHALAILENRKRFDLVLNTREYNKVLEALEAFEEFAHFVPLLDEMKANRVRFDKLTNMIISRNQHCLHGTPYERATRSTASDGDLESGEADIRLAEKDSRRKIREFVASKAFGMAAGLADMYLKPLDGEEDRGVLTIPALISAEAIVAYARNGEHDKVKALVKGFGRVKGDFGHALTSVISTYSTSDHAIVYDAFRASLFQNRSIFRVIEALELFHEFKDPESTMALFRQAFDRIAAELERNGGDFLKLKKKLAFDRVQVVRATLQTLIEHNELDYIIEVLNTLDARGFPVRSGDYTTVFRLMREQGEGAYSADDFYQIWEDMIAQRDIAPTKAIVAHSCIALAGGTADQQDRLLKAYALARANKDDGYVLPWTCFSALLTSAAKRGTLSEVQALYDDAMQSHAEAKKANPKIKFVPRDWMSALVHKLERDGADPDVVVEHVKAMKTRCGGYSLDAVLAALRVCALANKHEHVAELRTIFTQAAKFRLSLGDGERLMRLASSKKSLPLAMLAIELFEQGNLVQSASSPVAAAAVVSAEHAGAELVGGDAAAASTASAVFQLEKSPTRRVLKKILWLYGAALKLQDPLDPTDPVTEFLRARRAEVAALQHLR